MTTRPTPGSAGGEGWVTPRLGLLPKSTQVFLPTRLKTEIQPGIREAEGSGALAAGFFFFVCAPWNPRVSGSTTRPAGGIGSWWLWAAGKVHSVPSTSQNCPAGDDAAVSSRR